MVENWNIINTVGNQRGIGLNLQTMEHGFKPEFKLAARSGRVYVRRTCD